jgi:hypothetical protein
LASVASRFSPAEHAALIRRYFDACNAAADPVDGLAGENLCDLHQRMPATDC